VSLLAFALHVLAHFEHVLPSTGFAPFAQFEVVQAVMLVVSQADAFIIPANIEVVGKRLQAAGIHQHPMAAVQLAIVFPLHCAICP